MHAFLHSEWPWYVAGPLIGLFVPALLLVGNKVFGVSASLSHICAAVVPGKIEYFRYDWRRVGSWNLVFLAGVVVGGFLAAHFGAHDVELSPAARNTIAQLGIHDLSGFAPQEIFNWHALLTVRGFVPIVVGGFLVGLGTAYAAGCTSGHAISGLANLQPASLIAVIGFFAGGLAGSWLLLPLLLGAR
ncbi:YeeE/YedE family protein [Telmatobacter bradus]|uniref:YeeE/YedE family protein n=1 Tax=Telmatobacter bradus TaxID=474953 RepID=UPI003B42AB16